MHRSNISSEDNEMLLNNIDFSKIIMSFTQINTDFNTKLEIGLCLWDSINTNPVVGKYYSMDLELHYV